MIVLVNGKLVGEKDAVVSIFSEAFMFGRGVFETMRTYNGHVFKVSEHVKRLFNSASIVGVKVKYSASGIGKMIESAAVLAKASTRNEQKIKVIAINGSLIVVSEKLKIDLGLSNVVKCKSFKMTRAVPEAKTLSYLDSYLTHEKAVSAGAYEAILTADDGEVYEGAYSNIFWFDGDGLRTRKDRVLRGVTGDVVRELSPFKFRFASVNLAQLKQKKEVFLTKTLTGIVPIVKIDGKLVGGGHVGKKTKKLIKLFDEYTKNY